MKNFKDGDATKDPFMSPLLAPDEMLSGLPPVHIVVSSMASLCFLSPWKKSKRVELADIQLLANSYAAARIRCRARGSYARHLLSYLHDFFFFFFCWTALDIPM